MKRIITGEVSLTDEGYKFDYSYNYPNDILHLYTRKVYNTAFKGSVYYFGYEFNKDANSKARSDFIKFIKGTGDQTISTHELSQFIENPLNALDDKFDMYSIDCFVYPLSGRSPLVQQIVDVMNGYCSRDAHKVSYTLVKSAPTDIEFDWEAFESDIEPGTNQYNQMKEYIDTRLMPAIHELDYFLLLRM